MHSCIEQQLNIKTIKNSGDYVTSSRREKPILIGSSTLNMFFFFKH